MCSRILIIEDNPANLEMMDYLLKFYGHEVLAAMDGEAGLELAQGGSPEIIVCDIQIPKLDGFGVARHLKADDHLRHIPLVAITALAMVGDRELMLAGGFDGYISKPIEPQAFVAQLEAFLPPGTPLPPDQHGKHRGH
jgi:two-component system cell cycle response regulator